MTEALLLMDVNFTEWDGRSVTVYAAFVSVLLTMVSILLATMLRRSAGEVRYLRTQLEAKQLELNKANESRVEEMKTVGGEAITAVVISTNAIESNTQQLDSLNRALTNGTCVIVEPERDE